MIRRFMLVIAFGLTACGTSDNKRHEDPSADANPNPAGPEPAAFATTVHPLLQRACGACHTAGAKHEAFVDDDAKLKALAPAILERIKSDNARVVMPPSRAREPLTAAEIQTIEDFLKTP